VAHDLNNILGGIMSYPELLLMQVPPDSPLRKHLLTIQKSGEKAAAVVQDLLTLARRGVPFEEITNLNGIVSDYFKSPEFERLKNYHGQVEFETLLDQNLLNIKGSGVHLFNTVMNLVANSAEAITGRGLVTVATQSRYIDRALAGFDQVAEGEYVILEVSDNGVGLNAEEIERIFEPFYTKKVMGRSGTGLGMAVVWGTVKDHHGYIDVKSSPGRGSTFTLYFPANRSDVSKVPEKLPVESYRGHGELVLIADDVAEQREIAGSILEKIGYRVITVDSGEAAVEYLRHNRADILVLDMIMDPGLDGLETYRKIRHLRPEQKVIIASGYSETDRVKEAQALGVGAYIKKPYTLEKLGVAVRNELSRKPDRD